MAKIAGPKRHGTYIILGEQVEWAKELVVLEIEGPGGLEVAAKGEEGGRLNDKLFGGPDLAVLFVVLRRRDARCSPRPATMVAMVVMSVHVRRVVLRAVARKHDSDGGKEVWRGKRESLCRLSVRGGGLKTATQNKEGAVG